MPAKKLPGDLGLFYLQRAPPAIAGASKLNTYFPSLETLFPSIVEHTSGHPTLAATELVLDVSADGTATVESLVSKTSRRVPVWLRKTHLVDPLDVMTEDIVIPEDGALPTFRAAWQRSLRKLNDPFNEAYTDAVFACMASRLVETGKSPHFCRFFGTFNGRVPEYTWNLTQDLPDVQDEPWFAQGLKKGTFRVIATDPENPDVSAPLEFPFQDVRPRLAALCASSETDSVFDAECDSAPESESEVGASDIVLEEAEVGDIEASGEVATIHRPTGVQFQRSETLSQHSGSDSGSGSGSGSSDDDLEYFAVLPNFPAQITVLERGDGTMDQLMEEEEDHEENADYRDTKEQRWTAWIFQVIAGLTAAQHYYDFVHNDLHTNNVIWSGTGETHLYYHVAGAPGGDRYYRVPTYGRLFKIIDFGRATFRPPTATGDKHLWIPDAYAPGADAGGQYNFGRFFDQEEAKVAPNRAFDLCRMAVAMLETLWTSAPPAVESRRVLTKEAGRTQHETESPLWNLLWLWLTDRHGRNMLRSPDGDERYPNFDLYCAIARDAQNSVPAAQLTLPLFDGAFRCARKDIPADATVWTLYATPAPSTGSGSGSGSGSQQKQQNQNQNKKNNKRKGGR